MTRAWEIDYIRQAIYQTLLQEHLKNNDYIGGVNELALTSFYEHLLSNEEIDRYVETVRDLNDQQNRTGLIANGTILSPSNPTITNLNQVSIIPMDFTINFRCTLANRDLVRASLNNMVSILKGRKVDIAELDNGKLFLVGTIANNSKGTPLVRNGDYIGDLPSGSNLTNFINGRYATLSASPYNFSFENYNNGFVLDSYFYFKDLDGKLKVAIYKYDEEHEVYIWSSQIDDYQSYPTIIFPPEHNSFEKWCLSISFDSNRCSEPRTLNAEDYCEISFGGSATVVSASIMLGNQLAKLGIKRYKVVKSDDGNSDTTFDDNYTWLEPLEIPSGNSAETQMSQLMSNKFVNNSHTDSIAITNQYTFVIDESINLLKQFFKYARYGIQTYITPNIIYYVVEMFTKWGDVEYNEFKAKIIESIDIEQTESDTLTITLPMQIQGDNN